MNTKFKRFTIITCLVTFLFLPFSRPQKAHAIAGVDDAVVILGLVFLSLAGYTIVANDDEMVKDIGRTIGEGLDGMWDITMGEDGFVATSLDWYADKFTESYIGKEFGAPKTVSKFEKFPYGARLINNYNYGTVTFPKNSNANVVLKIYNGGTLEREVNGMATPGESYRLWSDDYSSPMARLMFYSTGYPSEISGVCFNEFFYDATFVTFEFDAFDKYTGERVDVGFTNQITIPYDGTQVKAHDTPLEVPKGTTITVPKDVVDNVASGSLPTTIEKVEDIGVTVDKDVAGDGVITGWKWLDKILTKILDAILSIPGAIKDGIASLFIPTLDLSDIGTALCDKFNIPTIDFPTFTDSSPLIFDYDLSNVLPGFKIYKPLDWDFFSTLRSWLLGLEVFIIIYFFGKKISALHGGGGE